MNSLLICERMIVESLLKGAKRREEISNDTGIELQIVDNIISLLMRREIIKPQQGYYRIDDEGRRLLREIFNSPGSVESEMEEFFSNVTQLRFKTTADTLSMRKVRLGPTERSILQSYFYNIKKFFDTLEEREDQPLSESQVIYWGACKYSDLINQSLSV